MKSCHRKKRAFSVMGAIGLTLTIAVLSGCKSTPDFGVNADRVDKTRATIEKTIQEPERRAAILQLVNCFGAEAKLIGDEAVVIRAQIVEANQNYDTTREELEQLYNQLGVLLQKLGDTAKQRSLAIRKLCTEEEWKEITSHRTDLFNFTF